MNIITVSASKKYDIKIGHNLLSTLGQEAKQLGKAKSIVIVSDSNVFPIYGLTAQSSLEREGFSVSSFVFPAGESSKCGETFLSLLNFLAENRLTRSDMIVALGGGVVGDLAGFAASAYLRGIRFIQVPTTLLAMVDSSVGGKTAIDLPAGKNLVGAFWQPSLVLCDIDALNTLPEYYFIDGCAEVIKYGILYDSELFDDLANHRFDFDREDVISKCIEWKKRVVMEDEFDTGARMKLNLGHTFGHGIEAGSHFALSHGRCVAIGTAIAARASTKNGRCSLSDGSRIIEVLNSFNLPTETDFSAAELLDHALSDKKRSGKEINVILPTKIGNCEIIATPIDEMLSLIEAGL